MKALRLKDLLSPVTLKVRELELDTKLVDTPKAQAQRVHCELLKELKKTAPWMIPLVHRQ